MNIKLKAIHQAVALLTASGAQFAVEFEGQNFGNAKLQQPEPSKPPRTRGEVQFRWADLYSDFIHKCKPGDVFTHKVEGRDAAHSLRSSLSSRLAKLYGNGSYLCTITPQLDGKTYEVQAMFVERTDAHETAGAQQLEPA